MLTPKDKEQLPRRLVVLYEDLEEQILADICRRIAKTGRLTDTAQWQIIRLKELGSGEKELRECIEDTNELSTKAVRGLFRYAADRCEEFRGSTYGNRRAVPIRENRWLQGQITAIEKQTEGEFTSLTRSMGFVGLDEKFHDTQKTYAHVLDYTQLQISSGAFDTNTVIRQAVKKLADSGLRWVDYESGHCNRIDVAVRRAALTGIGQLTGKICENDMQELETDLVEVTAHSAARDTGAGPENHKSWQGRWYSMSGQHPRYPSLRSVTGYGTGPGLKGWGCRHDMYPVIEGISIPSNTPQQLRTIDPPPRGYRGRAFSAYEATQKQRDLETNMRMQKRRCIAYEAAGLEEDYTNAAIRLQRLRTEYREFSRAMMLPLQNERAQELGFGRRQAAKASWSAKKDIEKYSAYHYNKDGTIIVTDDLTQEKHPRTPQKFKPYAVIDTLSRQGIQHDRTMYDSAGLQCVQIHNGDHGNPKKHPFPNGGGHLHEVLWKDGVIVERTVREPNDNERKEHGDLL